VAIVSEIEKKLFKNPQTTAEKVTYGIKSMPLHCTCRTTRTAQHE
jgi:hypothetical protein